MTMREVPNRPERWRELNPDLDKKNVARYRNDTEFINFGFIIGTDSQQILQSNASRNYLLIQNKSASSIYLVFGGAASTFSGILIEAGGYYEPYIPPRTSVNIIGAAANLTIIAVEGTRG